MRICLRARTGRQVCKFGALCLLLAITAVSTLARDSHYLPQSNPTRYVSKSVRMEETSAVQTTTTTEARRTTSIARPQIAEARSQGRPRPEAPAAKATASLTVELLRSPPSEVA